MRRGCTTVRGGSLHYWRTGTDGAETVVMLHGLGGNHRGLAELAAELPGCDVVVPDLPGYGESEPLPGAHTLTAYADAVADLCAGLDLGRVHLLGHSLGASIALVHAARHPGQLRSLCLLNPVSTAGNLTATLGKAYYRIAARLPARMTRFWLASRAAVYVSDAFVIVTRDRARRRWILEQDYRNYAKASVRAMVESFLSYYETPFDEHAAALTVPTLLLTGDRDGIAPPKSVSALAGRVSNARYEPLAGAGHLAPVELPKEVAAVVRDFHGDPTRMMAIAEGE
jgi:pimeloyl-ACP methyl ester carboxylesterase